MSSVKEYCPFSLWPEGTYRLNHIRKYQEWDFDLAASVAQRYSKRTRFPSDPIQARSLHFSTRNDVSLEY